MGSFGGNVHNGGNVRNVPVYDVSAIFSPYGRETPPPKAGGERLKFIEYLGKKTEK